MSKLVWAWTFDRAWYVCYRDGVEASRISRRELVECASPHALLFALAHNARTA
jgi:hypothetical protein